MLLTGTVTDTGMTFVTPLRAVMRSVVSPGLRPVTSPYTDTRA